MNIAGCIDFVAQDRLSGWVLDHDQADKAIAVHLYINGVLAAHTLAENPREDLAANGLGDSAYSFRHSKLDPDTDFKVVAMPSGIELNLVEGARLARGDADSDVEQWNSYEDPYVYPISTNEFRSRFGGLWTDQADALQVARTKRANGEINDEELELLLDFIDTGLLCIKNAIPDEAIENYNESLRRAYSDPQPYQWINGSIGGKNVVRPLEKRDFQNNAESLRLVEFYEHNEEQRELAFTDKVVRLLSIIFDGPVLAHQSLHFEYGSGQALHLDTAFVRVGSPMSLVGVWYALEDVQESSGELMYIPGSHHWPEHLFEGRTKWMNSASNGPNAMFEHIKECSRERCVEPVTYLPKKGDVLFWANDLVHGGAEHAGHHSRKSLVVHYCSYHTEPMYFYYGKHSGKQKFNDLCYYTSPQKELKL